MEFDHTIDSNDNGGHEGGFGKEKWRSALKGLPQTSKSIWGLEYRMHPKPWKALMLD